MSNNGMYRRKLFRVWVADSDQSVEEGANSVSSFE